MNDITQESIDTKSKEIKKRKSLFYMLKCKHMYIKLNKKIDREPDPIKQCDLAIEAKRWWDDYRYSRRLRSK